MALSKSELLVWIKILWFQGEAGSIFEGDEN
jgi:hypothetical protein